MALEGLLGKKIGATTVFREGAVAAAVTAVSAGPCVVTQIKTSDHDGYQAVQLGYQQLKRLNKPRTGHLGRTGGLFRYLREFRTEDLSGIEVGQAVDAGMFSAGDRVDAIGWSKGRGFAGGVKRYHFAGGPKTHGQSDRHRAPGAIGSGTSPGHVIKGLRMAGHMGNRRVTVRNLEVVLADPQRNLLLLKGAVPGARNGLLLIQRSSRRGRPTLEA